MSARATVLGAALLAAAASACAARIPPPPGVPPEYRLVYAQDFTSAGALADFAFTDAAAWRLNDEGGTPALELAGGSRYQPPHRSPLSIALLREPLVGDFVLEADLVQTGREYGHRDLCLFFGFQSPARYYYVHLATTPDPNAHNVFLVDDAPRRNLMPPAGTGVEWGTGVWHTVRLERRLADGRIRVFFDDLKAPVFETFDVTLGIGRVGFGSFDDSGRFARVRLWAAGAYTAEGAAEPFAQKEE